jgi:RNA polymerase sigma-70 factor, ECF subfamily
MATTGAGSQPAPHEATSEGCSGSHRGERPTPNSDVALVVRVARGDHVALAALFDRHAAAVHGLAARLCGSDHADEVVQEVFVRLWQRPERFDIDRGSLRTFLHTDTHGRAVDLMRSNGARRKRELTDFARQQPQGGDSVDDAAVGGLLHDDMAEVIATLPRRERDPIVLAYFEGHTYREVAAMLQQPEGTIKSRIRAGLSRLRTEPRVRQLAAAASAPGCGVRATDTIDQDPNRTP